MSNIRWKHIPNLERYKASETGEVYDTLVREFIASNKAKGYFSVLLFDGKKGSSRPYNLLNIVNETFDKTYTEEDLNPFENKEGIERTPPTWYQTLSPIRATNQIIEVQAARTWATLIARCYNEDFMGYDRYGGSGVFVCEEWKSFNNFAEWFSANYIYGWAMDKDIGSIGQTAKLYSPETVCFVPQTFNSLVAEKNIPTPKYRVTLKKFELSARFNGATVRFRECTEEDCYSAYRLFKKLRLEKVLSMMEVHVRIYQRKGWSRGTIDQKIKDYVNSMEV